jgi:large subunit ribosomal protein L10
VARADKVAAVAEITEKLRSSSAVVVTEYTGLSVAQLTELRKALGDAASYRVAKNTLAKLAAQDAGMEALQEWFSGSTAITFVDGEPVQAAKALRDFARRNTALGVKGGYMEGRAISAAEVDQIAQLESREVLLGKLAGAMKGNLTKVAGLFNAPASQVARMAAALRDKQEQSESAA